MAITFFTDITTSASNFCLLNVKRYHDVRKLTKKIVLIDPSVYELKNSNEYSRINFLHDLVPKLCNNEYISIDYPCDMNPTYTAEFIEKSIQNNLKYRNNTHYICTVQSAYRNWTDFKRQFEYLESLIDFKTKIIGIGNLCRIMHPSEFTDNVFHFLKQKRYAYHFYGLSLALIKHYLKGWQCSVDSTKWTRAVTNDLKAQYGLNCNKANRDEFFLTYMDQIDMITPVVY